MQYNQRPKKFSRWNKLWNDWHTWLEENQVSALQACLNFPLDFSQINRVVVGLDSLAQLEEIVEGINEKCVYPPNWLTIDDPNLTNPSSWNRL